MSPTLRTIRLSVVAAALAAALAGCPRAADRACLKAVSDPRLGKPLNRVALVYSNKYEVALGGLESRDANDVHKTAKIYCKLVDDGLVEPKQVFVPEEATREQLLAVHTEPYLRTLSQPAQLGKYLTNPAAALLPASFTDTAVLRPFRYATGGTILTLRLAREHGIAVNIGGGFHHARPDRGEACCIYADIPIAIRLMQAAGLARKVLIIDLDANQGDGSEIALAGDKGVYIFSMHEGDVYPDPKTHCDRDVELPAGTKDSDYLAALARHLPEVLEQVRPDLVVYDAGCDPLFDDPFARMKLSPEGIVKRDTAVVDACAGKGVPVAMVLGSGFSASAWQAQYQSIRRIIQTYGSAGADAASQPTSRPRP